MSLEKNGVIALQWDVTFDRSTTPADFRVESADLTGSGRDDIVVATMNGVSNGMAIHFWKVRAIVEGTQLSDPIPVEDYGVVSYLTRAKSDKQCRLLAAHWLYGWEPGRGGGLYLMGRWFTYSECCPEWDPVSDRPAVYRRYLFSFERLRAAQVFRDRPQRLLWFADTSAKELVGPYPPYR